MLTLSKFATKAVYCFFLPDKQGLALHYQTAGTMKRLLLFILLVIGTKSMSAQDCTGYIPQNAIVLCDTSYDLLFINNTIYWMVNDTVTVWANGNNNTFYYTGTGTTHARIDGKNNKYYMVEAEPSAVIFGNANTIYFQGDGFIDLRGDSNIIYAHNLRMHISGINNIIHADSIHYLLNTTGTNNTILPNPCSSIQVSNQNAPPNPCNQTTDIIEDMVYIDVFPNPAINNVTFNLQNAGEIKTITIYDIAGKTIEVIANINADKATIDTSKLSTGMYVYSITLANGKTERGKLVVR